MSLKEMKKDLSPNKSSWKLRLEFDQLLLNGFTNLKKCSEIHSKFRQNCLDFLKTKNMIEFWLNYVWSFGYKMNYVYEQNSDKICAKLSEICTNFAHYFTSEKVRCEPALSLRIIAHWTATLIVRFNGIFSCGKETSLILHHVWMHHEHGHAWHSWPLVGRMIVMRIVETMKVVRTDACDQDDWIIPMDDCDEKDLD